MNMKKLLALSMAWALSTAPAFAQVNTVPQLGLTTGYLPKVTYSSAFFGFVPVVTISTDEICLQGSASRVVRLQRLTIYGTTTTAAQTLPIQLVRRVSLNTGGTPASTTANPGVVTQINSRDTAQATNLSVTAVPISWTAAPTIVDTAPTFIESQLMNMPFPTTSTQAPGIVDFNFQAWNEDLIQPPTIRGAAQAICVNIGAAITNASVWNGTITWTEE